MGGNVSGVSPFHHPSKADKLRELLTKTYKNIQKPRFPANSFLSFLVRFFISNSLNSKEEDFGYSGWMTDYPPGVPLGD